MFTYGACRNAAAQPRRSRKPRRVPEPLDVGKPFVVTVVSEALRDRLTRGTEGVFVNVHVDTLAEAEARVRSHRASAVLIGPEAVRAAGVLAVERMVVRNPGLVTVGVLLGSTDPSALLALGAARVCCVFDLSEEAGWNQLRGLAEHLGGETRQRIHKDIMDSLATSTDEVRSFFGTLVRLAPNVPRARELAEHLCVPASTLTSRFFRVGAPAPKTYLAMIRLVYAAAYFEQPRTSIAMVAFRLGHSSPQSFGRHMRGFLGVTCGEFRRDMSFTKTLDHFIERLIRPHLQTFTTFRPIERPPLYPDGHPPKLVLVAER